MDDRVFAERTCLDSADSSMVRAGARSRAQLFTTPWTVARQAPLSVGFSRQEHWSGLTCPPLGALPNPGIEPGALMSPALAGGFFTPSAAPPIAS